MANPYKGSSTGRFVVHNPSLHNIPGSLASKLEKIEAKRGLNNKMTESKGWDVVVHFDSKEDADKFEESIVKNKLVNIPGHGYLEATYVETLECPR